MDKNIVFHLDGIAVVAYFITLIVGVLGIADFITDFANLLASRFSAWLGAGIEMKTIIKLVFVALFLFPYVYIMTSILR